MLYLCPGCCIQKAAAVNAGFFIHYSILVLLEISHHVDYSINEEVILICGTYYLLVIEDAGFQLAAQLMSVLYEFL